MNTNSNSQHKPPYLLGLLCLLPLIGAFVGIALILYGILKYKNKLLIVIGSFGVIFTIGLYFFLFYRMRNGQDETKSFALISQKELDNLAKQVEFYKMQNNAYPNSLEQLNPNGTFLIKDPLLLRKMDKTMNTDFQYKRFGKRYTLFSVGIDGKPHTPDDLYPVILNTDTIILPEFRTTGLVNYFRNLTISNEKANTQKIRSSLQGQSCS